MSLICAGPKMALSKIGKMGMARSNPTGGSATGLCHRRQARAAAGDGLTLRAGPARVSTIKSPATYSCYYVKVIIPQLEVRTLRR